jgi:hypothetical protein
MNKADEESGDFAAFFPAERFDPARFGWKNSSERWKSTENPLENSEKTRF